MSDQLIHSETERPNVKKPTLGEFLDDMTINLLEKCRIYEEALQTIEISITTNKAAKKIAGEALDHFRCGTCGADISE